MTALADAESKITGFDVGGVDYITKPFHNKEVLARVNTHLTIRRIQKDLQARNRELDAFAHTVAHDIRNSLNRIMGFAEMLSEEYNTISADELKKYSDIITRSGRQMSQLVEALLLLAGVRKQEVELTPLDMSDIVDGALHRLSDMIDRYQAEIILPQAWPTAMGYAPWVEEVWVNYLDNALKYGGQPPCLELFSRTVSCVFWCKTMAQALLLKTRPDFSPSSPASSRPEARDTGWAYPLSSAL